MSKQKLKREKGEKLLYLLFFFILSLKTYCKQTFQDQMRALDMIQNDPELSSLVMIQAPLVDVEIRGVPALKFMGDIIWKWLSQSYKCNG